MELTDFMDMPPESNRITAYDEKHFVTYLRILDAAAEGADWREVAELIFTIDPIRETKRARTMYDSHLARAKWMARTGYSQIAP